MTSHLGTVAVHSARNRGRAAFVACALLLGIGWTAPIRGEARSPVSATPSAQGVALRPVGLPTHPFAPRLGSLRAAKLLQTVALGDFNGDGIMDFAVADFLTDKILVMLGDGEGHFRLAAKLPSESGPRSIVAGDFNHDGLMDLAVANFFSGDVNVFLGRGDGSFEDPQPIPLAPGLSSLAAVDLDSSGSLDLVAANFLSGTLTVLKGAPDGSFTVEATLGPATAVSLVYVQDFNGDGHQDLIAVDASGKQAWLFAGNGHGAFQPGQSIDPQLAASRLGTQPRATATTAALSPLPAIAKAAGDGQLAYPGSVLPVELAAAVSGTAGGLESRKPVVFSSLYGGAVVMASSAAADAQGRVSAKVTLSALPDINLLATSASGEADAVFGAASVLSPADFFRQVESALFSAGGRSASLPGWQLLDKAQSQLKSNDVVGAVVTLEACLELLAPAEFQPDAGPAAPSAAIDLLKRLLNQTILFASDVSGTISCGQVLSGTIATGIQDDYYNFSASAGDIITFPIRTTGGSLTACADLYNVSSSTQVTPEVCNALGGPFTIPTTGAYEFVVHDYSYTYTGSYNLGLQFMQGQCPNGTTGCGQVKNETMGNTTEQDVYTFTANAGDIITFPIRTTGGSLDACADLYNTSGTQIATKICNGLGGPFTIPATGTYIFVVHDNSYYWTGTYSLGLQFMQGQCPKGTTGCGQVKNETMGNTAEQDVYTFTAHAGDIITFPTKTTSGSLDACTDLYNSSGTQIATEICNGLGGPFTIPATGTYIFVVHDAGYFQTGTYNLDLQFMQGQCPNGTTGCGQVKNETMGNTAEQDVYTFSASAGDIITFPIRTTGGSLNACADLYNTSGTQITPEVCNSLGGPFTIPATGTYIFVVHDAGYFQTGTYNLDLQFMQAQCAKGTTGCGQIWSPRLANTAEQDVYTFVATAGEVVDFSIVTTSGSLDACLDLYNASGTQIATEICNNAHSPFTIPATGAYILVVHDVSYFQIGNYNLSWTFPLGCPAVTLSAGGLNCGTQVLNTSSTSKTVTLSNTGIHALTVNGITNQGANPGDFGLSTNCGTSVAALGGNCSIGVTFTPTGPGPRKTALTINDNALGTPHRVLLTGVGTAVSLAPGSLNFVAQTVGTTSSSQQITVTNEGSATVDFFEIALGGANAGDFSMDKTCGSTLASAATCAVTVTFKPTATGARAASVLLSDNGGGNLQSVRLSGTGQ